MGPPVKPLTEYPPYPDMTVAEWKLTAARSFTKRHRLMEDVAALNERGLIKGVVVSNVAVEIKSR